MLRLSRRGFNCNVVRQMRIVYGGVRGPIFTFAHGTFTSETHGREWVLLMWTRFDPMCEDDPSYFVDIKSNSRWTSWALQSFAAYYFYELPNNDFHRRDVAFPALRQALNLNWMDYNQSDICQTNRAALLSRFGFAQFKFFSREFFLIGI